MPKNDTGASTPSWYTPVRLLMLLCILNVTIYVDRGTFASNSVNGNPEKATGFQVSVQLLQVGHQYLASTSGISPACRSAYALNSMWDAGLNRANFAVQHP